VIFDSEDVKLTADISHAINELRANISWHFTRHQWVKSIQSELSPCFRV